VHIEANPNASNLGNLHPLKLGKILADKISFVSDIRRLGRNIISINFKYRHEANWFVENENLLPEGIGYIPNYKILRIGIVKGIDLSLNESEIRRGIRFPEGNIEIRSLFRLKHRDKSTLELKDSSSVKIEFASNLLPEYLSIWSVRCKVRPYINRVRKCFNCFRWGHFSVFCKGKQSCTRCGKDHNSETCESEVLHCINCGGTHHPFDVS